MIRKNEQTKLFVGGAFALLTFMMLFQLTYSSPWGDEWIEYVFSQRSIRDGAMYRSIINTFQPPLYNFVMHFWLKLGTSILWFRLFNVLIGEISAVFLFLTVKRLTNIYVSVLTIGFLSICYHWVYCIQECSEYALMLLFLFGAFYFFVRLQECDFSVRDECFFIFMCIGAIYSQYGAFFCIFPMLLVYFFQSVFTKKFTRIIRTSCFYLAAFLLFAVPLYLFFLKIQLANRLVPENAGFRWSSQIFKDMVCVFGNMLVNFFEVGKFSLPAGLGKLIGLVLLGGGFYVLVSPGSSRTSKKLCFVFLCTYVVYIILVSFHVYASRGEGESYGYYTRMRYAYFFIPVLMIIAPVIFSEISRRLFGNRRICHAGIIFCILVVVLPGLPGLLDNWHKAYDKEFTEIWLNNAGFNDDIYLFGEVSGIAFRYYVGEKNCKVTGQAYETYGRTGIPDYNNLPDRFWVWRTNWGGRDWKKLVKYASRHGYEVEIYADHGYDGQLARCIKKSDSQ